MRKQAYVCNGNGNCVIGPETKRRKSCPKCRHDKCLSVGMSKEGKREVLWSIIIMHCLRHCTRDRPINARSPLAEFEGCEMWIRLFRIAWEPFSPGVRKLCAVPYYISHSSSCSLGGLWWGVFRCIKLSVIIHNISSLTLLVFQRRLLLKPAHQLGKNELWQRKTNTHTIST